jgi:hypothetical protein
LKPIANACKQGKPPKEDTIESVLVLIADITVFAQLAT